MPHGSAQARVIIGTGLSLLVQHRLVSLPEFLGFMLPFCWHKTCSDLLGESSVGSE